MNSTGHNPSKEKKPKNLLSGTTHHYHQEDAIKYGIYEAIFLYRIKYLVNESQREKREDFYRNGKYWVITRADRLQKHFPWATQKKWQRVVQKLKDEKIIDVEYFGNLGGNKFDRSRWITLTDELYFEQDIENTQVDKMASSKEPSQDIENTQVDKMASSEVDKMASSEVDKMASSSLYIESSRRLKTTTTTLSFIISECSKFNLYISPPNLQGHDLRNFNSAINRFTQDELLNAFKAYSRALKDKKGKQDKEDKEKDKGSDFWAFIRQVHFGDTCAIKYFNNVNNTEKKITTSVEKRSAPYHEIFENEEEVIFNPNPDEFRQKMKKIREAVKSGNLESVM